MNVTFIKGLNAAFHRIGLVQYASDKLGHDLFIGAGGQRTKYISEETVPALLRRGLFCDDHPHPVGEGKEVFVFRLF